ncbi:MAG: glycosyltransferase family 2 protein [Rhodobacterales bacterium]|nr:glycosyltransferase family 2 protein [Rhodobacterales bacterium]MDX5413072.1 glycosyltransferase family 2 protein [Rhodobacterales bacterium]
MTDRTAPRLLTVLLNWRTAPMTLRAAKAGLAAMAEVHAAFPGARTDMVIVDNDSGDGSFEMLRDAAQVNGWTEGGAVRVIHSGHNGGFGAGNNVGIRAGMADGEPPDFVYLLNSDAFPEPGALVALIRALEADPQAGIAGSFIYGDDDVPHETAFRFPTVWSEFEESAATGPISRILSRWRVPLEIPRVTTRVDWLAGASMMIRRDVLDRVGIFDETFFLYYEETDLCHRAARAGFATVYVPESRVMHIGSVSTGMKSWNQVPEYWFDSRLHYFTKTHGAVYAVLCSLAHVFGAGLQMLRRPAKRRKDKGQLRRILAHHRRALGSGRGRNAAQGRGPVTLRDMKGKS